MGSPRLSLVEVRDAMDSINQLSGHEANVIFGATTRQDMTDAVSIILILTGLPQEAAWGYRGDPGILPGAGERCRARRAL
jgi:cell division GTPase FtsZ